MERAIEGFAAVGDQAGVARAEALTNVLIGQTDEEAVIACLELASRTV